MSIDLARFLVAARESASLKSSQVEAVQKKMLAIAIDPLLTSMPLDAACRLSATSHGTFIDLALGKMTLAQLKKTSKAWNPHRAKFDKGIGMADIRAELRGLLAGDRPASPAPRAASRSGARR